MTTKMALLSTTLIAPAPSDLPIVATRALRTFLSLPAEIRNEIYHLLLSSPLIPTMRKLLTSNQCSAYVLTLPLHTTLLSTCKQIYTEASPILYSCNTFSASPTLLTSLPYLINPARPICCPGIANRIKRWYIKLRIDCDARFSESDVSAAFAGAEELEVEAVQAAWRGAGTTVLMLFQGVRGVGSVRVHGSVDDDFARWLERSMMSSVGKEVRPYEYVETRVVDGVEEAYDPWNHGNR